MSTSTSGAIANAILIGLMAFIGVVIIAGIVALPTMWILNYVLSDTALFALFGGALTFWKAFWLNVVCGILFKGTKSCSKSN